MLLRQFHNGTNIPLRVSQFHPLHQLRSYNIDLMLIYVEQVKDSLIKDSHYATAIDEYLKNIREFKIRFIEETQLYQAWSQRIKLSTEPRTASQPYRLKINMRTNDQYIDQISAGISALRDHLDDMIARSQCKPQVCSKI